MKFPPRFLSASLLAHALGFLLSSVTFGFILEPTDPFSIFENWFLETAGFFSLMCWIGVGLPWSAIAVRDGWSIKRLKMFGVGVGGAVLSLGMLSIVLGSFNLSGFFWFAVLHGAISGLSFSEFAIRWRIIAVPPE